MEQGFTRGLGMCLNQVKETFALRYWIIDNSGSMQEADGTRLLPAKYRKDPKMVQCTRWEEIKECINYHINLASLIQAPTRFRLLNDPGDAVGPQQFSVAEDTHRMGHDVQEAFSIMRKARPGGCTPLTKHILEIHHEVSQIAPELRKLGKKVAVIIATDSIPSNERGHSGHQQRQEFAEALRLLEGLPIWIAIRLCTDEADVTDYYNDLNHQLEFSLEVLDDFSGEALEVKRTNPWINYGLPLHRIREMGFHDRVLDLVDERPLTRTEVHSYCTLLFGGENSARVSDPSLDWKAFLGDIERLLRGESKQWDPVKKTLKSWINIKKLDRMHNDNRGSIMKRLMG